MGELAVVVGEITNAGIAFLFVVPGQFRWSVRSVYAVAATDVGGAPNRAFQLTITDGTSTVAQVGAADAGTEPATVNVTFADVPSAAVTAGAVGITQAPIPPLILNAGYRIIGAIINPAGADAWVSAVAWVDQSRT